jgi:zinc protease
MDKKVGYFKIADHIEVYYLVRDKLPIFYANLLHYRGTIDELGFKRGIHSFVLRMLLEGPKGKSPAEFSRELEQKGLRIKTRAGYAISSFEIDGLSDYFFDSIKESKEIITNPAFREEDFQRLLEQYRASVLLGFQDPEFVTTYFSTYLFFRDFEALRTLPDFGLIPDVFKLSFDELKNYYSSVFKRASLKLVVVSNIDLSKKIKELEVLSEISPGEKRNEIKGNVGQFKKAYIVDMKIEQAHLKLMVPTIDRRHQDYQALRIANFIIGGSDLSSRLMKRLRVREGLTYGVSSVYNPGIPVDGQIVGANISIQCETEMRKSRKALELIYDELAEIREKGFSEEELADAKSFYKGSLPLRVESYAQVLSMLTEEIVFGLPFFHWEEELKDVENLKLEEINQAAFSYFNFDSPFILLVGNASKLEREFKDMEIEVIDPWKHIGFKGISLFSLLRRFF